MHEFICVCVCIGVKDLNKVAFTKEWLYRINEIDKKERRCLGDINIRARYVIIVITVLPRGVRGRPTVCTSFCNLNLPT